MARFIIYCPAGLIGGHELMTMKIAETAVELGHHPTVLYRNDKLAKHIPRGVEAEKISSYPKLKETVRKSDPAFAIVPQGHILLNMKGLLIFKRLGVKTVSYIPTVYSFCVFGERFCNLKDRIARLVYRLPDAFITITDLNRENLEKIVPGKRVFILNNFFNAEGRTGHHAGRQQRIGMLGRLVRHKGFDDGIRIFRDLTENGNFKDLELLIGGEGEDRILLENMATKYDMGNKVTFRGWVRNSDFYPEVDLLLLPSHFEGFPLVLLEAISSGIPVIGRNTVGISGFLPDEWLFKNIKDARENIESVLNQYQAALQKVGELQKEFRARYSFSSFKRKLDFILGALE